MASTTTQTQGASSNSISRIFGVFFSPKETFASIAQRPTWLAPIILSCLVSVALMSVFSNKVGWRLAVERNIQNNALAARQMDQLSPEQRQVSINAQMKILPYAFFGGAVAGPFIFTMILAGIFLGLFKLVYGAQLDFKTSMGVVAYAFLPRVLYALVGMMVIFLKDPSQVDIQNLLASNPGALLSADSARWLIVLATQIDFFSFWIMILLAIGFHAANPKKISTVGAFAGIAGLWLFYVIILTGFTAAFS
jgi:hypothetical protein